MVAVDGARPPGVVGVVVVVDGVLDGGTVGVGVELLGGYGRPPSALLSIAIIASCIAFCAFESV